MEFLGARRVDKLLQSRAQAKRMGERGQTQARYDKTGTNPGDEREREQKAVLCFNVCAVLTWVVVVPFLLAGIALSTVGQRGRVL